MEKHWVCTKLFSEAAKLFLLTSRCSLLQLLLVRVPRVWITPETRIFSVWKTACKSLVKQEFGCIWHPCPSFSGLYKRHQKCLDPAQADSGSCPGWLLPKLLGWEKIICPIASVVCLGSECLGRGRLSGYPKGSGTLQFQLVFKKLNSLKQESRLAGWGDQRMHTALTFVIDVPIPFTN